MTKKILIGLGIIGIVMIVGVAAYVLRPTAEASAPIEAIPVEVNPTATPEPAGEPTEAPPLDENEAAMSASEEEIETQDMPTAEEPTEVPTEEVTTAESNAVIFTIVQDESEVRFTLGELLSGVPTTVVGTTDQVAGEIAIDPAAPANSKVGVILVNARTLTTDNNFRNRAINNEILDTNEFEFIQFTPTSITGFPENPAVGETLEFQIIGDLTIRDITNEVVFNVTVTAVSETRLEGSASAVVDRADYDLRIPNVPRVADVDEEVLLEIDFVAIQK
jgi:polyisoprenoid-binding protein YceI